MAFSPRILPLAAIAALAAACAAPSPPEDWFAETGEMIAFSGGDAGVRGACATCHGVAGEGDGALAPRLAGADPGHLVRQIENFANGRRRHAQMSWIAARLDWRARQRVAAYYAALPVPEGGAAALDPEVCAAEVLYHRGDPQRGIEACSTCHGDAGEGVGPGNPPLAGQPAPYLAAQLSAWRSGERYGDPLGVMLSISRRLSDSELANLAGYTAALPGATGSPGPPEACLPARRSAPRSGA